MAKVDLDTELAALAAMTLAQLRERWTALTGHPVPQVRQMLLRQALAWELQASVYGGLARRSERRLVQLGRGGADAAAVTGGMTLMREWKGTLHTVKVDEHGAVQWAGKNWNSLSQVARAITGTRWSGTAFFGLKQKVRAA